jgi:hypothetical protein
MDTAGCIYSFGISFSFWARAGFTAFLFCPRGLTDTPSISIKKCIIIHPDDAPMAFGTMPTMHCSPFFFFL